MAAYFSYFPNVYVGEGLEIDDTFKYRLVKNLFRRVKVREDLDKYVTSFESYSISDGETPSSLAYELYSDQYLDWIILLVNNITDVYTQWPKSQAELQSYVADIYDDPDAIHHYETNEVLYNGVVFIKSGIQVNENYTTTTPDGVTRTPEQSRYAVTNYEYEYYLNEQKRLIVLPQAGLVDLIEDEMKELLSYTPHVEVDDYGNKKTNASMSSRFIKNSAASTGSVTI
ncbi:baseplate wedge component [Synechococcus phage S-H25]|nr:baseplate wedge component [Synechococcus phage S-H25]